MPDCKDSKVYKITCNITSLTYYGSATAPISKRMVQHRSVFKNNKRCCKFKLVLASGDYDYCLVESYPCADKSELHEHERFYIESNECVNKNIPGRTQSEYQSKNKEKILEYKKVYRDENKEKIKAQNKAYHEKNKETINGNQKKHYEANKEKISEYQKGYRAKSKDELNAKAAGKITCECGCTVRKGDITTHRKSQKHINLLPAVVTAWLLFVMKWQYDKLVTQSSSI